MLDRYEIKYVKKLLVMCVDKVQAIGQMHIFSKISVFHE